MYKFRLKELLFFSGNSEKVLMVSVASGVGGNKEKRLKRKLFFKKNPGYRRTLKGGGEIS